MKTIYKFLIVISSVLLLGTCIFPATQGIPINVRLIRYRDKWELKFTPPDIKLFGRTEAGAKTALLIYLENRPRYNSIVPRELAPASLVTILFSLLGLRREKHFMKKGQSVVLLNEIKGEPGNPPNPHSPSAQGAGSR